jgi:hypothetical protein
MKSSAAKAEDLRVTLVPQSPPMPQSVFEDALLKRRCAPQHSHSSPLSRALRIILAKKKAAALAREATTNPPAPAPDSAEAVALAAEAAEHSARVAEVTRRNEQAAEAHREALLSWEQATAACRSAERKRLLAALAQRRARRATETAELEAKLAALQTQNVSLMRQLKTARVDEDGRAEASTPRSEAPPERAERGTERATGFSSRPPERFRMSGWGPSPLGGRGGPGPPHQRPSMVSARPTMGVGGSRPTMGVGGRRPTMGRGPSFQPQFGGGGRGRGRGGFDGSRA